MSKQFSTNSEEQSLSKGDDFSYLILAESGRILALDFRLLNFLGFKDFSDLKDRNWYSLIHPEHVGEMVHTHALAVSQHGSYRLDFQFAGRKDGLRDQGCAIPSAEGDKVYLAGVVERVSSNAELKSGTNHLASFVRDVFVAGTVGQYYYDVLKQQVYWSEHLRSLHGVDQDPKLDKYWTLLHPDDLDLHLSLFANLLQTGKGYKSVYRIVRPKDQCVRYVYSSAEPVFSTKKGDVMAISGITIDITDAFDVVGDRPELLMAAGLLHMKGDERINIRHEGQLISLRTDDIIGVSAMKDYIKIFVEGVSKPYVVYRTLWEIAEQVPKEIFMQTHKSHLVNLQKIERIVGNNIVCGSQVFLVSRTYRQVLLKKIGK